MQFWQVFEIGSIHAGDKSERDENDRKNSQKFHYVVQLGTQRGVVNGELIR